MPSQQPFKLWGKWRSNSATLTEYQRRLVVCRCQCNARYALQAALRPNPKRAEHPDIQYHHMPRQPHPMSVKNAQITLPMTPNN